MTTDKVAGELVTRTEIARRLGVAAKTVHRWHQWHIMPAPVGRVGTRPLWRWEEVKRWAKEEHWPR